MSRTLSDRARDPWWWLEQVAHVAIGAAAASVLWIAHPIVSAIVSGSIVAILREWEQRPVTSWGDLAVDVAATIIGSLSMGIAVWGVTR